MERTGPLVFVISATEMMVGRMDRCSRAKAASKQGRDRESRAMPKGSAVVSRDSRVMARVSRVMTMITMRNPV